ncbi:MAG: lysylphosphatidylglycerol synthase transmembrane domain-containing protein [Planctomycetaceae bacterium]
MSQSRRFYQQPWFQLTFGILVTLGCLGWAFFSMAKEEDPATVLRKIGNAFREADYRTLPVMLGLVLIFYWLKAWRWTQLLKPVGSYTTRQVFPPVMIGFAFNNLLPAHLGEFVRVFVFSRRHQQSFAAVLSTVVLERIFDILAILGFFFWGLTFVKGMAEETQRLAWGFAAFVAIGLVGAAVYLIWTKPFVRLVEAILAKLPLIPAGLRDKICRVMEGGAAGLASLKSGWLVGAIGLNSLIQWGLNGLVMSISLRAFGVDVSPLVCCLLLGVVAFAVTVPASPGYFGVIQAAFLVAINQQTVPGVSVTTVFAASIYYHMSQYVMVTLLGLVFFNLTGLSMQEVRHEAEEADEHMDELDVSAEDDSEPPAAMPSTIS